MDIEALVKEIEKYFQESEREKGSYWLVMLVGSSDSVPPPKWNLVLSAPWIDAMGHRPALAEIARGMKAILPVEAQAAIERFSVLRTNDPFVQGMGQSLHLRKHRNNQTGEEGFDYPVYSNSVINGYEVPYGIVVVANIPRDPSRGKPSSAQVAS
jgi:hypothetical protein